MHCDVKPANVMLGPGAKLIDFGIAIRPHDGIAGDTSIGSLRFMSPEQLHGEALTPASDLFSLGAVLYEALTGRPPFPGDTPEEVSAAHAAGRVRPPSTIADGIPGRLDEAILQALRPDPDERFSSADAMAASLEASADEIAEGGEDTTQMVRVPPAPVPPADFARPPGYVPPVIPSPPPAPAPPAPRRAPAPPPRRGGSAWGLIGTLLVLGAAALVVLLVVLPLLELGREGGGAGGTPVPTADPGSNTVIVPDVVGMPICDALVAADESGLDWTLRWEEDPGQPEGIIDQEPQAGTEVAPGSPFTLYSARVPDCP